MNKTIIKNSLIFLSYFFYQLLVFFIVSLFNINVKNFSFVQKNIYLFITDLIYLIILVYLYKDELKSDLSKFKKNGDKLITKYFPIYLLGVFLMGISNMIVSSITKIEISSNEEAVRTLIKFYPVYMIFSSVIYAPIVEELIFRKSIRKIFDDKVVFILISGFLFGLVHVIGGNTSSNELLMGIPYIVMGIDLAYIYYKSDNIFTTMFIHSMHNFILLLIQLFGGN